MSILIAIVVIALGAIVADRIMRSYARGGSATAPGEPDPMAEHERQIRHG